MNAEISNTPLDGLADCIAAARTFSDLADARRRLQHAAGIPDADRCALENALIAREKSLLNFYLPNRP
jgi:hypothetical protein